jgi:hypothetical protein
MNPEEAGFVSDVRRSRVLHAQDMASYRRANDIGVAPTTSLENRIANLSADNAGFAVAVNLALTMGMPVCVIDRRGEALTEPTRDPEQLMSWWSDGSEHALRWPGVPCGRDSGLFGLELAAGDGVAWLKRVATERRLGRVDRLLARLNKPSATQLGVPGTGGDWWNQEPEQTTEYVREPLALQLVMREVRDLGSEMATSFRGEQQYRQAVLQHWALAHRPLRSHTWLVWHWVDGLPSGGRTIATGVRAVGVLPARDSLLDFDEGCVFRTLNWPGADPWLQPPPGWLTDVLKDM